MYFVCETVNRQMNEHITAQDAAHIGFPKELGTPTLISVFDIQYASILRYFSEICSRYSIFEKN
jgi:hypothetical protein